MGVPDARTLAWAFGRAHEDRIKDAIRDGVRDRAGELTPGGDEYWRLVAEVAVEAVLYDLVDLAESEGDDFRPRRVRARAVRELSPGTAQR